MSTKTLKTKEEIDLISQSCEILSRMLGEVVNAAKPGVTLLSLDKLAEEFILDNNAIPACKGYCNYPNTLCLSVNDKVVHGIPNDYILKEGDIVSIDSCVQYKGFCSDSTYTVPIGEIQQNIKKMLHVCEESLYDGIKQCTTHNRLGDIGYAIEQKITSSGFFVVKKYSGHGIGRSIHELPKVLNYGIRGNGEKIQNGLVLAIEPIIGETTGETKLLENGWDVLMANGCMSAHFEHTVAVYDDEPHILTTFKYCKKNYE